MADLRQLASLHHKSSFRRVNFITDSESVDRGQKVAVHEYPNSDKRFAEPLGKIPPIIDLRAYVAQDSIINTDNAFEQRKKLEEALEKPGPGELIHPVYGAIQVQVGPYTVKSNQRQMGRFDFEIKFYSSTVVTPNPVRANKNTARQIASFMRINTHKTLDDLYEDPEDSFSIFDAVDTVNDALDAVNDAINDVVDPIEEVVAKTKSSINKFRSGIYSIVQTAAGMKNSFEDLYNTFIQLSLDPGTLSNAWMNLINFGTDSDGKPSPKRSSSTYKRSVAANNRKTIESYNQTIGYAGLMEGIGNTDFASTAELNEAIEEADQIYSNLFENNPSDLNLDPDVRSSALDLKDAVRTILDSQSAKTWRSQELDPGFTSLSLASYRYYGNIDLLQTLIDLNPDQSVSQIKNPIQAITT